MFQELFDASDLRSKGIAWIRSWIKERTHLFVLLPKEYMEQLSQVPEALQIGSNGKVSFGARSQIARMLEYGAPDLLPECGFITHLERYLSGEFDKSLNVVTKVMASTGTPK